MHACEVGKTNPTKWIQQENFRLSHNPLIIYRTIANKKVVFKVAISF